MSTSESESNSDAGGKGGIYERAVQATDDLVSVTVRKTEPDQKAGISLVERQGAVYITKITENGLFENSEIEIGDLVLSINQKRLRRGEGAREILKHITKAKATVTMVVKKANKKARRGARSLSPSAYRKRRGANKLYKKVLHRNDDGSLKYDVDPRIDTFKKYDDDGKDQIPIKAHKIFANQEVGVAFKVIDKMIFVSGISLESIFQDSDLALGDRVVAINDMNFMTYADANYAMKLLVKQTKEVIIYVEKGHENFNIDKDVDSGHSLPKNFSKHGANQKTFKPVMSGSKSPCKSTTDDDSDPEDDVLATILAQAPGSEGKAKKAIKPIKLKATKPAKASKPGQARVSDDLEEPAREGSKRITYSPKAARTAKPVPKVDTGDVEISNSEESSIGGDFEVKGKMVNPLSLSASANRLSMSRQSQSHNVSRSDSLQFEDFGGDYIRVTVKKNSEDDPGIAVEKTAGKFILTALPEHEKRVGLGSQVLAINGTTNINTVIKAEDLMKRKSGEVVLIINLPTEQSLSCPCCGDSMTATGEHSNGSTKRRGKGNGFSTSGSMAPSVALSVTGSVKTAKSSNKAPRGQRVRSIPESRSKYKYDEYDSDSDGSDEEKVVKKPPRPSIASYEPNDRFMIRVSKIDRSQDPGIRLIDYKTSIYVSSLSEDGPFYTTPILVGDKILSVNGRKGSLLKNSANAMGIIEEKDAISLFVLRPDPNNKEYQEAAAQFPR